MPRSAKYVFGNFIAAAAKNCYIRSGYACCLKKQAWRYMETYGRQVWDHGIWNIGQDCWQSCLRQHFWRRAAGSNWMSTEIQRLCWRQVLTRTRCSALTRLPAGCRKWWSIWLIWKTSTSRRSGARSGRPPTREKRSRRMWRRPCLPASRASRRWTCWRRSTG